MLSSDIASTTVTEPRDWMSTVTVNRNGSMLIARRLRGHRKRVSETIGVSEKVRVSPSMGRD